MNTRDLIEAYAMAHVLRPYRWGGDDPLAGFDCSGLVLELLKAAGVVAGPTDMTAQALHDCFEIGKCFSPVFGTLLFFGVSDQKIDHVTMAMNPTHMIEAGGGGSTTRTLADAVAQNAYVRIRPIARRGKPVAMLDPPWPWRT